MTSMPASRNARAMIFAPRSCPSRPGLATTTRIFPLLMTLSLFAFGRDDGGSRKPGAHDPLPVDLAQVETERCGPRLAAGPRQEAHVELGRVRERPHELQLG